MYGYKVQKHCYKTLLQLHNIDTHPTTQLIKDKEITMDKIQVVNRQDLGRKIKLF